MCAHGDWVVQLLGDAAAAAAAAAVSFAVVGLRCSERALHAEFKVGMPSVSLLLLEMSTVTRGGGD